MRGLGLLRSGGGCGLRLLLSKTEPGRFLRVVIHIYYNIMLIIITKI